MCRVFSLTKGGATSSSSLPVRTMWKRPGMSSDLLFKRSSSSLIRKRSLMCLPLHERKCIFASFIRITRIHKLAASWIDFKSVFLRQLIAFERVFLQRNAKGSKLLVSEKIPFGRVLKEISQKSSSEVSMLLSQCAKELDYRSDDLVASLVDSGASVSSACIMVKRLIDVFRYGSDNAGSLVENTKKVIIIDMDTLNDIYYGMCKIVVALSMGSIPIVKGSSTSFLKILNEIVFNIVPGAVFSSEVYSWKYVSKTTASCSPPCPGITIVDSWNPNLHTLPHIAKKCVESWIHHRNMENELYPFTDNKYRIFIRKDHYVEFINLFNEQWQNAHRFDKAPPPPDNISLYDDFQQLVTSIIKEQTEDAQIGFYTTDIGRTFDMFSQLHSHSIRMGDPAWGASFIETDLQDALIQVREESTEADKLM